MLYRINLGFAQLPDSELDEFTSGIIAGLTGNPAFSTPAVSIADLTAGQTAFEGALTAMVQGGTQATAYKNNMRDALVALLRKEAAYVQLTATMICRPCCRQVIWSTAPAVRNRRWIPPVSSRLITA